MTTTTKQNEFNSYTDTPCGRAMAACEEYLQRPLRYGEMIDFLLDNFEELANSDEAKSVRDSVVIWFGRTISGGLYTGKVFKGVKNA